MDPLLAIWTGFSVLVGAVLGSFANVCIARWPDDRSVVTPRSACPSCGTPIAVWDNVPVVSWVLLRGRCRRCAWPIPPTYPLVELLGACVGFLVFRRFVPDAGSLDPVNLLAWAFYLLFAGALLIGTFVDVRHRILPDQVTVYAIPVGVLGCAGLDRLGFVDWLAPTLADSVAGALVGGLFFGTIALSAQLVTGREALGWGDVRMLAMIGSFLGVMPALYAVLLASSITAALVGIAATLALKRRVILPFGPHLGLWAVAYVLYGQIVLPTWIPWLPPLPVADVLRLWAG